MSSNYEVLAQRSKKAIYKDGDTVLKVFESDFSKADILNEALNQARIEETGLNVPKLLEVSKLIHSVLLEYIYILSRLFLCLYRAVYLIFAHFLYPFKLLGDLDDLELQLACRSINDEDIADSLLHSSLADRGLVRDKSFLNVSVICTNDSECLHLTIIKALYSDL